MNTGLHFSSTATEWETPNDLFMALDDEFSFDLDPAATPENAKCHRYYTAPTTGPHGYIWNGGLNLPWNGRVFLNCPYGREIGKWVEKAFSETVVLKRCPIAVCLLPARTDTRWFHDWCLSANHIRFIKGRIQFVGAKHAAPFPSMLVIFTADHYGLFPSFTSYDLKEQTRAYLPRQGLQ